MTIKEISQGLINLTNNLRLFWLDLAVWTRALFFDIESGTGNVQAVVNRLNQIPVEVSNLIEMIYGAETAERIIEPLNVHILNLLALVNAQKNGDFEAVNERKVKMYQNIEGIANLFSQINPFWDQTQWTNLLNTYLDLTFEAFNAIFSGDYVGDMSASNKISFHTNILGEYMAAGIIQHMASIQQQAKI